jgi:arylformamidase
MSTVPAAIDLESEYNPRLRVPEFAEYFSRWKLFARAARETLEARLDLRYGPAPDERLDFFPAQDSASPLLIFIHGGYWRALDKEDFSWIAPPYVAVGISVAIINYGLIPATPMLTVVEQVRRACAWLHLNARALNIDPTRMVCTGHSAGGHLSAMMIATDWPGVWGTFPPRLLSAALTISGLFDLEPLTRTDFLRYDLKLDRVLTRALSPTFLPWRNDVPVLRAIGALETNEFHRQSHLLAEHWPQACDYPLIEVPGCNHFSVCDAFATPGSVLFDAALSLFAAGRLGAPVKTPPSR